MLNSDYVSPDKYDPHVCNISDFSDEYIFNILDLNIPKSESCQFQNNPERVRKRDPNGEILITDSHISWFAITAPYETTTHTDSYLQVAFHKLASIKFFDKNSNGAMIGIVFNKFIAILRDYKYAGRTP